MLVKNKCNLQQFEDERNVTDDSVLLLLLNNNHVPLDVDVTWHGLTGDVVPNCQYHVILHRSFS